MKFKTIGKETLASFIDRYVALGKRLKVTDSQEIITGVLIALPIEVQGDLETLTTLGSVKTLDSLMKIAHRYDSIISKRAKDPDELNKLGSIVSSVSKDEVNKAINSIREEFQRLHEETLAAIGARSRRNSRIPSEMRMCYNCRKTGHLDKDYTTPKQASQERKSSQRSNLKDTVEAERKKEIERE